MATLIFSAIGTAIGGPIGGAVGALIGRQVDSVLIGQGRVSGPRLRELEITTSSYGAAIGRNFGRMRVPGHIIWSTDLKESSETSGGKNRPEVTAYSYSVSFAVALSSRPILSIGRIWADGRLLRGEAGDLKVGGHMRIYNGHDDQEPDPLIAQIEGAARCPAYRGIAYVVFEDLDLTEFYNRIPALTFEVVGDTTFGLAQVVEEIVDDCDAGVALEGLDGFVCDGPLADVLPQLDPLFPIDTDANGSTLVFARERLQVAPILLPEPAVSAEDGDFGGVAGFSRRRAPASERPPEVLRYYDRDRDYQPGVQRVSGRPGPGQPSTIEVSGSMTAAAAQSLVERMRRKADWSRDRVSWRTCELDPQVAPGAIVALASQKGRWRVEEWELRDKGVELALVRVVPIDAETSPGSADPGRINAADDVPAAPTTLCAFELPQDATTVANGRRIFAAVSSPMPHWSGAALFVDDGSGFLQSLGPSGRTRSVVGIVPQALAPASPMLVDRQTELVVQLVGADMSLANATPSQLASGLNKALVGPELIQFARAEPLGNSQWRICHLLRGRGGTESAVSRHAGGERFVLLDQKPRLLDPVLIGSGPDTRIVAAGLGDPDPVGSDIALSGISLRPPAPVHPAGMPLADGSFRLSWVRRARGAWLWLDGAETPLVEETERYLVTYGVVAAPVATWQLQTSELVLSAAEISALQALLVSGPFHVSQLGSYASSEQTLIANL